MVELQAGAGFGRAARHLYANHRTLVLSVVLSVAGIGTGLAAASAGLQGIGVVDAALILAAAVCAAGVAYWQLRHLGLALVTAFAPLPGLLWAAPLSAGSHFGSVPVLAYGFAFIAAALVSETRTARIMDDTITREAPWRAAGMAIVLCAVWAVLWFRGSAWADTALQAVADLALATLSVLILLPLAADLLHFDETFVARANRARESRVRLWERIARVTIPRWAFSFTGIAIIFLALGWYGGEPAMKAGAALKLGSVLLAIVAAAIFAGGWRQGVGVGLVGAVVCLIALWASAVDHHGGPVAVLQITAAGMFLALYESRRALAYVRVGDPPLIAQRRMLEDASGQAFAGAGAVAALIPGIAFWAGSTGAAVSLWLVVGLAVVFVPAAVVALEVLMPRRRSVEELYGKGRKSKKS